MREQRYSQGRMARETGLSYNTVKKHLKQLDAG
jgi:DNA-binding CsgD family transcriptional regulator